MTGNGCGEGDEGTEGTVGKGMWGGGWGWRWGARVLIINQFANDNI